MSKSPHLRATALVELTSNGSGGVLVHADHHGKWRLPGGGRTHIANRRREPLLAAAVRELYEETGLTAIGGFFLLCHQSNISHYHTYLLQIEGEPRIVDPREAPALGLCGPDLQIKTIAVLDGFDPSAAVLTSSSRTIINSYYQRKVAQPETLALPTPVTNSSTHRAGRSRSRNRNQKSVTPKQYQVSIGNALLELYEGSIVRQDLDAVVNAANSGLHNGGGVAGAIYEAAGIPELNAACRQLGHCPTGEARLTPGFKLPARYIIHTVGPKYGQQSRAESERLLANAYTSSLRLARRQGLRSIAFPSLSTGSYGYPVDQAAPIALRTVIDYMLRHPEIRHVRFVLRKDSFGAYQQALLDLQVAGQSAMG